MIQIKFMKEEIDGLYEMQLKHESPKIRKKLQAVYLKSLGIENFMICKICRISWPMMLAYFKEYKAGGIERLTLNLHRGHPSELNSYSNEISSAFKAKPPATLKEARAKIKEITRLNRSLPQVWSFLHKLGLKPRKVGGVPGRVDVEEQEGFKKKNLSQDSRRPKRGQEWCIS